MILTLKPTLQNGYASPHAYSPVQQPLHTSTFSPAIKHNALPPLPVSSPRKMGTPHRGLPPPSAMTLPNPERGPSSSSMSGSMSGSMSIGPLPQAPSWNNGADESMRSWLAAKTEEEKRKAEEQKTQQETLKLEQRKVEQNILRESLQGGIPPYMVPMVFAGLAGGPVAAAALEWTQQAMASISLQQQAQLQQQQQQQAQQQSQQLQQPNQPSTQTASDQRRMITGPQPNPYGPQPTQQAPAASPQVQPNVGFVPSYQSSNIPVDRARLPGPSPSISSSTSTFTSSSRQPASSLPRLNTVDSTPLQQPSHSQGSLQLPAQHALQQPQQQQQQEQQVSSPLYFHHWVPPNTQTSSNKDPGTPTGKSQHESPYSQSQGSYLRSDYTVSPKKRKATGAHQAAPAPSSGPPQTSPSFSHTSSGSMSGNRRRNRSRQHSDASSRAVNEVSNARRPRSRTASGRQSVSEAESGSQRHNSAQPETRPSQQQQHHPAGSVTTREHYEHTGRNSPKRECKEPI
ncbi:MAG: hypothetical protein Q9218_007032 [Villophora microphyllina]